MLRNLIALHRHSCIMITYCGITGGCVWLSARHHRTFQEWISESDWSAFLLWHLQFHIWYLVYHALNFLLLGALRPFEKRKARKGQLGHFMNTLIFIIVVCGLDIFEGFCWLHWMTPFSFVRMSLIVISERLENPPPRPTTFIAREVPYHPSRDLNRSVYHNDNNCNNKFAYDSSIQYRFNENPSSNSLLKRNENKMSSEHSTGSHHDGSTSGLNCKNEINDKSTESAHQCQQCYCYVLSTNRFLCISTDNEILLLYLFILMIILFLWCICGALVFHSLPLASKFMVVYEPMVCCLQWAVVFLCVLVCDSVTFFGIPKDDVKFSIEWIGEFICQLLATCRYALVWLLFGHSLIFNVVDVLIFMKLKGCFSSLSTSVHNLRVFLAVRSILNRTLPTVYPKPIHIVTGKDTLGSRHKEKVEKPSSPSTELHSGVNNCMTSSTCHKRKSTLNEGSDCNGNKPDNEAQSDQEAGNRLSSTSSEKEILGRVARFLGLIRSLYGSHCSPSSISSLEKNCKNNSYERHTSSLEDTYPICVVCRDPMLVAKKLPCGHIFHQHCLRQWLDSDLTCPICRSSCLSSSDESTLRTLLRRSNQSQRDQVTAVTTTTEATITTIPETSPTYNDSSASTNEVTSPFQDSNISQIPIVDDQSTMSTTAVT